jgi:sugar/nucleoside kinase (ribokinase family)
MPDGIYIRPGGSAANVAAWAAAAGLQSSWMGRVGDDAIGEYLLRDLAHSGVAPHAARIKGVETGVVISWVGKRGNRSMHSSRAAAASVDLSSLDLSAVRDATAVHVSGYTAATADGFEAIKRVMLTAKSARAFVSFDPSDPNIVRAVGPVRLMKLLNECRVSLIFANRREARALTGAKTAVDATSSLARIVEMAIVKDGGRGCYLATGGTVAHIPAVRVPAPTDTTGAGDAFAGAWLAAYLRSADPQDACLVGSQAAALAIQTLGGRPQSSLMSESPPAPLQARMPMQ